MDYYIQTSWRPPVDNGNLNGSTWKWPLNYIPTAIGRNANNVDKCRKISLALVYLFRQTTLDIGRFCDGGKPILNPPWTYIRRQDGRC